MSVPPSLMAALATARSLQPQGQGNPTGGTSATFQAQIQTALSSLQAALGAAPDAVSASEVSYLISKLQNLLGGPGNTSALGAMGQIRP